MLIHPRALPLVDYVCANNNTFGEALSYFQDGYVSRNNSTPYGLPQEVPPDYDDDVCAKWLENGDEAGGSLAKNTEYTKEPSEACRDNDPEEPSGTATCADVEMRIAEDEIIFKSDQPGESVVQSQDILVTDTRDAVATEVDPERIVSDSTIPHNEASHVESGQGSLVDTGIELASQSNSSLQRTSDSNMVQGSAFKLDYGNSVVGEDPFPDIVDADPDSDSASE